MDLKQLIEANARGRSVEALGRSLVPPRTGNTVRGWASGKYPMPEYQAAPIAAWLDVNEADVLAAAEESRRVALTRAAVTPPGQAPSTGESGRGEGWMPGQKDRVLEALVRMQEAQIASTVALAEAIAILREPDDS